MGLILSVFMVAGGISQDVRAANENIFLSWEQKVEIFENLDVLNVPLETQKKLINKLENGELWDCMKEENIIAFDNMQFNFTPDNPVKRMVFKDGSVLQQTVNFKDATIVGDSRRNYGVAQTYSFMRTTFEDVQISINNGLSGGGFYADYVIDWNAHNDGIISVRDPYCNVIGGDYSDMNVTINQAFEIYSKKKPAEATYTVHVSYLANIGGAETLIIKMYVGNDKMVYGKLGKVSISY